jgi:hypothetical protein
MNNRERTMATFGHMKADRLIWQPRLHHWYEVNKARGRLPKRYGTWSLIQIYDDVHASPRSYHYFDRTIKTIEGDKINVKITEDDRFVFTKYVTPRGSLTQVEKKNLWGTNRFRVEYFLKGLEDFHVLEYILESQSFEFDEETYNIMDELLGDRCEPMVNVSHGSIQRFFIEYMGLERGVIALWKHRERVEKLLDAFKRNDDRKFDLIKKTPFKIINFGDNIDDALVPPQIFKKYMLPYYRLRTDELHQAGRICTSHWDGKIKLALRFARDTGLDGLECVPPEPQGNVTLEELKMELGDMTLVDGIPATHFMPYTSEKELTNFVQKILDLFSPNIILGISDMMPPDGDIERVRKISKMVEEYKI